MRKVIYLLPLLFSSVFLKAQVGTPIGTFGTGGVVIVPSVGPDERIVGMTIQNDGKLVVAGFVTNGADHDFLVYRFNPDGSLDAGFNGTGRVQVDIGAGSDDVAFGVAVQSNGMIVVAGYTQNGPPTTDDYAVIRLTTTGTLDAGFNGTGIVTTNFGVNSVDQAWSVAIQPSDGKIVLSGYANGDFGLVRYTTTGTLDAGFGVGGLRTTNITGANDDGAFSVAIQNNGNIVAAGYTAGANNDFAVVRYDASGTLDPAFNTTGIVITDLGASEVAQKVAIEKSGNVVVLGQTGVGFPGTDIAIARYTPTGTLDATFNGTGSVITDLNAGSVDQFTSMVLQADGKILVGGTSTAAGGTDMTLVRYTSTGALDVTFNGTGIGSINAGGAANPDLGTAVLIEQTTIFLAGYTFLGSNGDVALAAFTGDASSLPLRLLSFNAQKQSSNILLKWQTEREENILGFDIQRSSDGKNFKTLGFAQPITTTGAVKKDYSYTDNSPLSAVNYYRLVIKDLDGSFTYSKVLAIKNSNASQQIEIFPNPVPVGGILQIQLPGGLKGRTNLQITDVMGRIVRTMTFETGGNTLATSVDVSNLNKGVYVIRAKSDNDVNITTRFIKN